MSWSVIVASVSLPFGCWLCLFVALSFWEFCALSAHLVMIIIVAIEHTIPKKTNYYLMYCDRIHHSCEIQIMLGFVMMKREAKREKESDQIHIRVSLTLCDIHQFMSGNKEGIRHWALNTSSWQNLLYISPTFANASRSFQHTNANSEISNYNFFETLLHQDVCNPSLFTCLPTTQHLHPVFLVGNASN